MRDNTQTTAARLPRVAAPLRQELANQIRSAILSFEFAPGTRLVERALCERYGVSRTVVREALRQLEAEDLVTTVANHGPIVAEVTEADARALFEVRAQLEALAARQFAERADDDQRAELSRALDDVAEAFAADDLQRSFESKDHFYGVLLEGAGNHINRDLLVGLHARVQRLRALSLGSAGRKPQSLAEIRLIAEHAIEGDADEAAAAALSHVASAAKAALENIPTAVQADGARS